ncbi:MAG: replication factor C small subunit [Candidatus Hodarchaeota archaeon]
MSSFELWTEKYRPKTLDEIINQEGIVKRLKAFVEKKNTPNLLLAGPAGVGKTTAILAFANDLYGSENVYANFLELNASDERGIDVVRERIKGFARTSSFGDIPFKMILLDEADALTTPAQTALRRTMERFARTSRFALVVNYSSKIIEPIQSRCALFRLSPLTKEDVKKKVDQICENEGLGITEEGLKTIWGEIKGDLRKVINILQATAAISDTVTPDLVFSVLGKAHPKEVKKMIDLALQGNFFDARKKLRGLLIDHGLSGIDLLKQMALIIQAMEELSEHQKLELLAYLGEIDFRLAEGATEEIQLNAMLAKISAFKIG